MVKPDKPLSPIEKGLAGPGLLAQVAVSKYGDHLPLHRQEDILARHGVSISRSTQCDWMRQCAELLLPLWQLLKATVLSAGVIATDDTTVKLLVKGEKKAKTARIWGYGSSRLRLVVFDFTLDRTRAGPTAFLSGCHGYLQADAYLGYDTVFETEDLVEVGCWAHVRRKFCDAQNSAPREAAMAVSLIKMLFEIERDAKEQFEREQACPSRLGRRHGGRTPRRHPPRTAAGARTPDPQGPPPLATPHRALNPSQEPPGHRPHLPA